MDDVAVSAALSPISVAAPPARRLARRLPSARVAWALLGPAVRRLLLRRDKAAPGAAVRSRNAAYFNWQGGPDHPELRRLYEVAKQSQWDGATDLDWSTPVDPLDPAVPLLDAALLPMAAHPAYLGLPAAAQAAQRHALTAWLLSQFMHGEQGALFAACEVTEAVQWADGKLYGSTQVVDEGRHLEVFGRYLADKMQKTYPVNDNLFTIMDALVSDGRWDIKFLGMQIMIEGLALGAFGVMRRATAEPLLRELLRRVITDEARHVHYGVTALGATYAALPERARREREDWAYEVAVLLRNRFLAGEFYDEFYGHVMSRRAWDAMVLESGFMRLFREEMFRRLIPNLKRIHLLGPRVRPRYAALGLMRYA